MYHPSRGGVRGGRDQFKWDDVKVDKHRENYLGHSLKAPVGRWQKGKDLFWYVRDKNSQGSDQDALKAEIQKVKEEEEQMMREALGLAPKRSSRPQGNTLDKHEFSELVKRGSTAEDIGEGHAETAKVHGLGFDRAPRSLGQSSSLQQSEKVVPAKEAKLVVPSTSKIRREDSEEDENVRRKRRREERKRYKEERREKKHSRESNDKRKHRTVKAEEKKRSHDSD